MAKAKRRGHSEGTIVRRSDGRWQASISLGTDPRTGQRKRMYFYGQSRKEAADQMNRALADYSRGILPQSDKATVENWLNVWLWEYKKVSVRPRTFDCYESIISSYLAPAVGHVLLKDLRPDHLQRLYNDRLEAGLSGRTVQLIHTTIHAALEQALKNSLVIRNVSKATNRPKVEKKEIQPLTEKQVEKLLTTIRNDRLFPAIYVALAMGLRPGELLALQWQNIDLQEETLNVRQTMIRVKNREGGPRKHDHVFGQPKTKESRRTIPLPGEVTQALKKHKARQAQEQLQLGPCYHHLGLVFCTEDGKKIHPRNFARSFDRMLKRAGLPHFRLHDMRHTAATILLRQGVNLKVTQIILGHNSIKTTADLYAHVDSDMQKKAMKKMNAVLRLK